MDRSKFDIDLEYGQVYEQALCDILSGTVEVKTERGKWQTTGNVAVEFQSRGKPSGIAVTESDWWAQVFCRDGEPECIVLLPTRRMKDIARQRYVEGRVVDGGDDNTSRLVLVPVEDLIWG